MPFVAGAISPCVLTTERLVLVPAEEKHGDALWTAVEMSLPDLRPWLVWTAETSRAAVVDFIASRPAAWDAGSGYTFTVTEGGNVIGLASLAVHNPALTQGEVGYWLRSDRAGRGLMTEAARAVRDFAFDVAGRHRLNLRAGAGNVASQRVAEKIGFTREGMMRHGGSGAEGHYDAYLYGMLASDPRP